MNLHKDIPAFTNAIHAASDYLNILPAFIEKDYWITLALKRLAESPYRDAVVFKGGTSLSKGFKIINRFSEDIDIAIIDASKYTGNKLKTLIRDVEKIISVDLTEVEAPDISSKKSRYRKIVFSYFKTGDPRLYGQVSNRLIIEVNSFANPFPYENRAISSFITDFLQASGNKDGIEKYGMSSFSIHILDKRRTLIEKLASLFRFSLSENPVEGLSGKVRHFYDLYFLYKDPECRAYLETSGSGSDLDDLIKHDKEIFDEPAGWQEKELKNSPLLTDFNGIWQRIRNQYRTELTALAFTEIPAEEDVKISFQDILDLLQNS